MRRIFVVLAALLFLATVLQFYLAAVGAFDRPETHESFRMHEMTGYLVIPALSVLATLAAALARARRRLIGLAILPAGLVLVQILITEIGQSLGGSTEEHTTAGRRSLSSACTPSTACSSWEPPAPCSSGPGRSPRHPRATEPDDPGRPATPSRRHPDRPAQPVSHPSDLR